MICAGFRQRRGDDEERCQPLGYGDSGGPLVCRKKRENRWFLVGIVSWGHFCTHDKFTPGVFTRSRRSI